MGDGTLQQNDVGRLGFTDLDQALNLVWLQTQRGELVSGELIETLFVELGLEVLKSEGAA